MGKREGNSGVCYGFVKCMLGSKDKSHFPDFAQSFLESKLPWLELVDEEETEDKEDEEETQEQEIIDWDMDVAQDPLSDGDEKNEEIDGGDALQVNVFTIALNFLLTERFLMQLVGDAAKITAAVVHIQEGKGARLYNRGKDQVDSNKGDWNTNKDEFHTEMCGILQSLMDSGTSITDIEGERGKTALSKFVDELCIHRCSISLLLVLLVSD